jgi:hypothetical protein
LENRFPPRIKSGGVEHRRSGDGAEHACLQLDQPGAQDEFLDLPGRGLRKLTHEAPNARHLVRREMPTTEVRQVFIVKLVAGLGLNEGRDHLPPFPIGDADHGRIRNAGVRKQDVLDLARIDILPAPNDHVLQPALNSHIALRVDAAEVAGVEPALRVESLCSRFGIVEICRRTALGGASI